MTHKIGWEVENQARKTGRNWGWQLQQSVWLREQMLQTPHSSPMFCMAQVALLHLLCTDTGKI